MNGLDPIPHPKAPPDSKAGCPVCKTNFARRSRSALQRNAHRDDRLDAAHRRRGAVALCGVAADRGEADFAKGPIRRLGSQHAQAHTAAPPPLTIALRKFV